VQLSQLQLDTVLRKLAELILTGIQDTLFQVEIFALSIYFKELKVVK
jgi:hypothetical protein